LTFDAQYQSELVLDSVGRSPLHIVNEILAVVGRTINVCVKARSDHRTIMLRLIACAASATALFVSSALASDLRVAVTTPEGRPVADAVVTVQIPRRPTTRVEFAWPMRIAQERMEFNPFVLIAPAGATVSFPNLDPVRHHVYSFSPAGPFELRLYGRDESRSVTFRTAGVIAIGCNIHDNMSAFIYVVDTPFAAKTDAQGIATIRGLPAANATVRLWRPYSRAPDGLTERSLALPAGGQVQQEFQIGLRAPRDSGGHY
jgi:plastocyanin